MENGQQSKKLFKKIHMLIYQYGEKDKLKEKRKDYISNKVDKAYTTNIDV